MPEEFKLTSEDLEPPKKDRRKVIIISAAVAVVLILGVSGYLLWKNSSQKQGQLEELQKQVESLKSENNEVATSLEEQIVAQDQNQNTATDEYSGWNIYTNTDVGYELRYPSDWTIKETDTFSELIDEDVKYITVTTADKKYFLYWGLKYNGDDFVISDRTGVGAGDLIQEGTVTILGTNTEIKKLVYKNKVKEYFFPGMGSQKTADGKYYFSAAMSPGSGTNYDSLDMLGIPELANARLILSSVKIIPRTTQAAVACASTLTSSDKLAVKTWKTFKNDKYDYSFKYPEDWDYNKVSDKLINFEGDDDVVFSWRSEEMTALGYEGWETDGAVKSLKVCCENAKSTYLKQGVERMIFTQFKKDGKNHMTNFGYRYVGASISSDMVEMYDLILKSVEFE